MLFTFIHSQYVQVAPEIATAGAFLGGKLGTHSIHSNPALLGIQTGEYTQRSLVDTFKVSYGVKLAQSIDKKELQEIKTKLNQDGFERDYKIYKEDSLVAFTNRSDIKSNFMSMAKSMAKKGSFAGYATHDQELIDELLSWIKSDKIPNEQFEFQTLYGVPMNGRLEDLINKGYSVRVYVPFGPDWFDYSIRRLKENPDIAKYVMKNFFKNG